MLWPAFSECVKRSLVVSAVDTGALLVSSRTQTHNLHAGPSTKHTHTHSGSACQTIGTCLAVNNPTRRGIHITKADNSASNTQANAERVLCVCVFCREKGQKEMRTHIRIAVPAVGVGARASQTHTHTLRYIVIGIVGLFVKDLQHCPTPK